MKIPALRNEIAASALAFLAILHPCAHAQIVWQSAQGITGNSDLINAITTPGAVTFDAFLTNSTAGTPLTVDGVTFNLSNNIGNPDALIQGDGLISYTVASGTNNHYSFPGTFPTGSPSSPEFAAVMESGGTFQFGGAGAGTITISGLTLGDTYAVQIFNYAPDGDPGLTTFTSLGGNSVTISNLTINSGAPTNGQFATGTFTANSNTQSFDWNGAGSSYTVLGAINVANVSAVPEPSSYGLAIAGFAILLIFSRRLQRRVEKP